jgi:hypothetical protein
LSALRPAPNEFETSSTQKESQLNDLSSYSPLEGAITLNEGFKIENLNDSLKLINRLDSIASSDEQAKSFGLTNKFLEVIVTSPVFCNIELIPKCRYKFQSQFKRSIFSDSEKW